MNESSVKFYLDPASAWEAMIDDCKAAEQAIDFEQYILNDDDVGRRFLHMFAQKAAKGIKVRILLDRVGSRSVYGTDWIRAIEENGGEVQFFGGRSWLNVFVPWRWFPRNHTKVLLIDGTVAFIGSACIDHAMKSWRDTHMRYRGPMTNDMQREFNIVWKSVKEDKKDHYNYISQIHSVWRYVVNRPRLRRNPIYYELIKAIKMAKKTIYLASPYFVPPWPLRRALRKAVKRGVDVQVMIAEKSDVPIADYVSRSYFRRLLENGIKIFLYKKTVLHTKYAVIDDEWATIGSTNMDYLSFLHNREANVITTDRETVQALRAHFEMDMKECVKADKTYWKTIPLPDRIIGYAGRLIRRFL